MLNRRLLIAGGASFVGSTSLDWVEVYSVNTQTVPHNTNTLMTFDTVAHDPLGYWSVSAPTKLTVPSGKGGVPFLVMAGSFTNDVPDQDCIIYVSHNGISSGVRGSTRTFPQTGTNNNPIGYIATTPVPVQLNDGDDIEFVCYIDNGGSSMVFGTAGGGSPTWIALVRLA